MAEQQAQGSSKDMMKKIALAVAFTLIAVTVVVGLAGCVATIPLKGVSIDECPALGASWMLGFSGTILGIIGMLLDFSVTRLIINMGSYLGTGNFAAAISTAWGILRDVMNLAFIGGLIYAAFAMILQITNAIGGSPGKLVVKILIAALLVNFSYFFAGAIIDASNFSSKLIYERAFTNDSGAPDLSSRSENEPSPISTAFMGAVGITSIYKFNDPIDFPSEDPVQILLLGFLGSILFIVTAGAFLYATTLFLKRFVIVIYLLITSPLGVVGFTGIPVIAKWGSAWWKTIAAQAIFPPVFLLLIAIAFTVIGALPFANSGESFVNLIIAASEGTSVSDPGGGFAGAMGLLLQFAIAIGLILMATSAADNISNEVESAPPTSKVIGERLNPFRWTVPFAKGMAGGFGNVGKAVGFTAGRPLGNLGKFVGRAPIPLTADKTLGSVTSGTVDAVAEPFRAGGGKVGKFVGKVNPWQPVRGKTGYEKYSDDQIWNEEKGLLATGWDKISEAQQKALSNMFGPMAMDSPEFKKAEKRAGNISDVAKETLYAAKLGIVEGDKSAAAPAAAAGAAVSPRVLDVNNKIETLINTLGRNPREKAVDRAVFQSKDITRSLKSLADTEARELMELRLSSRSDRHAFTAILKALGKQHGHNVIDKLPADMLKMKEIGPFIDGKTLKQVEMRRKADPMDISPRDERQIKQNKRPTLFSSAWSRKI